MSDKAHINDDDLAAEYVLGVLDSSARAQISARIDRDLNFARLVSAWEERLSGLNGAYEEVSAPAHIKVAIDEKLFAAPFAQQSYTEASTQASTRASHEGWTLNALLARYRLPVLAAVILAIFLVPVINEQLLSPAPQVLYTANIQNLEDYEATFSAQITDQGLTVTQVDGSKPDDKDYELWLVRADGKVLTLGVLSQPLNPAGLEIAADSKLAISVEPIGGSPTGVATGPVIALGALEPA